MPCEPVLLTVHFSQKRLRILPGMSPCNLFPSNFSTISLFNFPNSCELDAEWTQNKTRHSQFARFPTSPSRLALIVRTNQRLSDSQPGPRSDGIFPLSLLPSRYKYDMLLNWPNVLGMAPSKLLRAKDSTWTEMTKNSAPRKTNDPKFRKIKHCFSFVRVSSPSLVRTCKNFMPFSGNDEMLPWSWLSFSFSFIRLLNFSNSCESDAEWTQNTTRPLSQFARFPTSPSRLALMVRTNQRLSDSQPGPRSDGIVPLSLLPSRYKYDMLLNWPNVLGMAPSKLFRAKDSTWTEMTKNSAPRKTNDPKFRKIKHCFSFVRVSSPSLVRTFKHSMPSSDGISPWSWLSSSFSTLKLLPKKVWHFHNFHTDLQQLESAGTLLYLQSYHTMTPYIWSESEEKIL